MSEEHGDRWIARPWLARLLRLGVFVLPLVASTVVVLALRPLFPSGYGPALGLGLIAVVVATSLERAMRRVLPLATLLRLTMLFPDKAPSRYKVARSAGDLEELGRRLADDPDAVTTAEQVLALITSLGHHDRRTRGHSERVRVFCDLLAEELKLDQGERDRLRWTSLLHDIGKLDVSPTVLNKPSRLDDREFALIRTHPQRGAELTAAMLPWLGEWGLGIVEHHERYNGGGYPSGLSGADLSRAGRIVGLVDAFETMTAARAYKKAMATRTAREELARCAGTHFDPVYVRAFLAISLPRLLWAMGPLSFLVQLPFLNTLAQAGSRSVAVSGQAATALAGAGAVATVGLAGALVPVGTSAAQPAVRAQQVSEQAEPSVGRVTAQVLPVPPLMFRPAVGPLVPTAEPALTLVPELAEQPVPVDEPGVVGPPVPTDEPAEEPLPADEPVVVGPPVPAQEPRPTDEPLPTDEPVVVGPPVPAQEPRPTDEPLPTDEPSPLPQVELLDVPPAQTTDGRVRTTFSSATPDVTYECAVDDGTWTTCTSPWEVSLPAGQHQLAVRAVDSLLGVGSPASTTVTIVAPSAVITSTPTGTMTSSTVSLGFTSDEPTATYECSVDGGAWSTCSSPATFTLPNGQHVLSVRAATTLGGTGEPVSSTPFTVAVPAPGVTITSAPSGDTGPTVQLSFDSSDDVLGYECAVDDGAWITCTSPQAFTLPVGQHTLSVRAVGAAGPGGPATTAPFTVTDGPVVSWVLRPTGSVVKKNQTFEVTQVSGATYECSVDGAVYVTCTNGEGINVQTEGTHVVRMRARGAEGVAGPSVEASFTVVPPTITSMTGPELSTISTTAVFTFTAAPGLTFTCELDGRTPVPCESGVSFEVPPGDHSMVLQVGDSVGDKGDSQKWSWTVAS